jgi:DNA-binding GntR family transcriptional regulator
MTELLGTKSLRVAVYERIQEMLVERQFLPGQHLPEPVIAAQLGVSRGPVREALQQLERDGWVDVRPRHGAFVHDPTPAEVDDFFAVRAMLEREATRLAAIHGSDMAAAMADPIIAAADAALSSSDSAELTDLNQQFHRAVISLADNHLLQQIAATVTDRSRWYVQPVVGEISHRAWQDHRTILKHIVAGEADAAAALMAEHVTWSRQLYLTATASDD